MTSLTMLCTDGSELATEALAAGLRVLAPADRTLVVTVVEPVDASLLFGASGFAGGVIDEQQYADTVEAHRDAAEEILGEAVVGARTRRQRHGRDVAVEGDPGRALVRSGGRARCHGHRRRIAWSRWAQACRARVGVRSPRAQRAVPGPRLRPGGGLKLSWPSLR